MYDPHLGGQLLDGLRLTDVGDLITKHGDHGQSLLASLEDSVALVAGQGAMPLVLGGDHSITLSVVDGLLQHHDRLGVLHFDAHHDYGRVEVGTGGNLHHGNFLGWVLGRDGVKSVAQFGVRQRVVERPQESPKVRSWPGTSAVVKGLEHIVSSLPSGLKWHLTFDVDVLDPTVMPSTGTVLPDGLTYREAKSIVSGLCRELDVISMDFVEFIPAAEEWPAAVVCGLILDAVVSALDFPGSSSD
jgi:agmatinase